MFVPDDAQLDIGAYMNPDYGYHFDGYSVLGIMPGDEENTDAMDPADPEQTITARGAAAIMANTALATAGDLPLMAAAFRQAIEAGRKAYLSGLGRVLTRGASASDPLTGFLRD